MFLTKFHILCLLVQVLGNSLVKSEDDTIITSTNAIDSATPKPYDGQHEADGATPQLTNFDEPNLSFPDRFQPPLPGLDNLPPNIFQFVTQLFKPARFAAKTYGPSVIAIIGDKPYISMEVFNKFSPFRWLMRAFQGKIQNICGALAPPPGEEDGNIPENILSQFEEPQQRPSSGPSKPQVIPASLPIRIYDIAVGNKKHFTRSG